ncbi:MAG: TonB-dependent receptor [Candidatus Delongbacteria bacterium]|nr:TonB-dependent receptor [Candidatus Delongbacteria bacterium]
MKNYWVIVVFSLAVISGLRAGTTGKISGRVTDQETGEPLIGANILIESQWINGVESKLSQQMGAASDPDGFYYIINLPPGSYSVRCFMIGYQARTVKQIQVMVDKTQSLDFSLPTQALNIGKEVVVTAEKKLIQKDLTSTSANIGSDVIGSLPVENFQDVVNLQAGVVDGHFRGGRGGEVVYMMNGISINDNFSGQPAFEVEKNVIEQLDVISGTFNAEYGQAMSGVVNIVTKEGSENYHLNLSLYSGDYYTDHTAIFWHKDHFNPVNDYNLDFSLTGPIIPSWKNRLTFFAACRIDQDNGYIWGQRRFMPGDSSNFSSDDTSQWIINSSGDDDYVPMNDNFQMTFHGKLTARIGGNSKLSVEGLSQNRDYSEYDHNYRINPEGDVDYHQRSQAITLMLNHTFSANSFLDYKLAFLKTNRYYRLYDNWYDSRYQSETKHTITSGSAFYVAGTKNDREDRTTSNWIHKLEYTSQLNRIHQIKTGIELRQNKLDYEYISVMVASETGWQPALPDRNSPLNNRYTHQPLEFSGYLQDKMEFKEIIINAGLRFDYFDPDGNVPSDLNYPDTSPEKAASKKYQWSPRLGIAYPVSDRGVLHISYGHFFQIPNFSYLYENSEFEVAVRSFPVIGNADLNPQRTITYEFGLQQQLSTNYAVDIVAFYKDIRDLIATEIQEKKDTYDKYARYINQDYGMVKGFTISLERRHFNLIGGSVDYTFQVAKGNASDPQSVWMDNQKDPPIESEKKMVALDWDRRHSLNVSLFVGNLDVYNLSFIARFGSGLPYTPAYQNQRTAAENSGRKPAYTNLDIYAYRYFKVMKHRLSLFFKVYNVLDQKNEINVYGDTGRAGYTLAPSYSGKIRGANTADEYYARPDYYSAPRKFLVGLSYEF